MMSTIASQRSTCPVTAMEVGKGITDKRKLLITCMKIRWDYSYSIFLQHNSEKLSDNLNVVAFFCLSLVLLRK